MFQKRSSIFYETNNALVAEIAEHYYEDIPDALSTVRYLVELRDKLMLKVPHSCVISGDLL
jgi:hypothetical protein